MAPSSHRPSLRDLARHLDLSLSTVSIALKDSPHVAPATKERVKQAAEKLGYAPDPLISRAMGYMKKKRENRPRTIIAYIVSHEQEAKLKDYPIFYNYYLGARTRARQLGYELEIFNPHKERLSGRRLMTILKSRGIEGVIISPLLQLDKQIRLELREMASITFGYSLKNDTINRVTLDQYSSVKMSLEEISKYGYKKIGIVSVKDMDTRMQHRWSAAHSTFINNHTDQIRIPRLENNFDRDSFIKWFREHRPDCLLCQGIGWTSILQDMGLTCGEDYGFATLEHEALEPERSMLDDSGLSACLQNAAGLDQGSHGIGALAVELLAQTLALKIPPLSSRQTTTLVEGKWVKGDTLKQQHRGSE